MKSPFEKILAKILIVQLKRIEYNFANALKSPNPEFIHDLRVAIRRARFALRLFSPFVSNLKSNKIRKSLDVLNSKFGEVRDIDITILRVKKYSEKKKISGAEIGKLSKALSLKRQDTRQEMLKAIDPVYYEKVIASVKELIDGLEKIKSRSYKENSVSSMINKLANAHLNKLSKWEDKKIDILSSEDLHNIRIAFKRIRYLIEFFSMFKVQKTFKEKIAIFVSFQDVLGRHQDALTVIGIVKKVSLEVGLDKEDILCIIKAEERRARKSRDEFRKKWKQFCKHPKF
jgi:CHAD domain-containing protein